jgi:hypothetical protein
MPTTANLVPDRTAIRLSGSLTLKATLEGPAPLRVDVPAEVLSDASAQVWQIAPIGSAKLLDLPGGTQRWSQDYKLSPFAPGDAVPLALREFSVSSGNDVSPKAIAFPALTIRVETSITSIKPEDVRPITGIEELPPLPPGERALRELDALVSDGALPENLAAILRTFAAQTFDLPAETMTTAELAKAHPDDDLTAILAACDRARFAGVPWTDEESREMRERALGWVRARLTPKR